jgi:hypothetical protein
MSSSDVSLNHSINTVSTALDRDGAGCNGLRSNNLLLVIEVELESSIWSSRNVVKI